MNQLFKAVLSDSAAVKSVETVYKRIIITLYTSKTRANITVNGTKVSVTE